MNTKLIIKTFLIISCAITNARLQLLEGEQNSKLAGCLLTEQLTNVPTCSKDQMMAEERRTKRGRASVRDTGSYFS